LADADGKRNSANVADAAQCRGQTGRDSQGKRQRKRKGKAEGQTTRYSQEAGGACGDAETSGNAERGGDG
jgi:hypothetical protein